MPIQILIEGHLLIPFGRPKWDISKIRLSGVSPDGTYILSDTPCAYIDRSSHRPLTLAEFPNLFPGEFKTEEDDADTVVEWFQNFTLSTCDFDTEHEKRFLRLYFDWCRKEAALQRRCADFRLVLGGERERIEELKSDNLVFRALMPLPQAHVYCRDPLADTYSFVPERMHKADFGFWDGHRLIAVEIDGASHIGNAGHVTKDRALQRAGVMVIHILNKELDEFGQDIIKRLLPRGITEFCLNDGPLRNPLAKFPF